MEMPPFKITTFQESKWAKDWLLKQISEGRLCGLRVEALRYLDSIDDVKRFLNEHLTDIEDRRRLQKALSARRFRGLKKNLPEKSRKVTTELDYEAREILLTLAKKKGLTTSDLIRMTFIAEFEKLD